MHTLNMAFRDEDNIFIKHLKYLSNKYPYLFPRFTSLDLFVYGLMSFNRYISAFSLSVSNISLFVYLFVCLIISLLVVCLYVRLTSGLGSMSVTSEPGSKYKYECMILLDQKQGVGGGPGTCRPFT